MPDGAYLPGRFCPYVLEGSLQVYIIGLRVIIMVRGPLPNITNGKYLEYKSICKYCQITITSFDCSTGKSDEYDYK